MKKMIGLLLATVTLVGCSDEEGLTKEFVEEHAQIGLSHEEVRDRFGEAELADVIDMTETWLYDETASNEYDYDKTLEVVAFDEIKAGDVEGQLYINFIDDKAFMYSYYYLGDDDKIWEYQIVPTGEPRHTAVSD